MVDAMRILLFESHRYDVAIAHFGEIVNSSELEQRGEQKQVAHDQEPIHGSHVRHVGYVIAHIEAQCGQTQHTHDAYARSVRRGLSVKKKRHP